MNKHEKSLSNKSGQAQGKPTYRFVPAGTAWYRLGPDKFFSPRKNGEKNQDPRLWWELAGTQSVGDVGKNRIVSLQERLSIER